MSNGVPETDSSPAATNANHAFTKSKLMFDAIIIIAFSVFVCCANQTLMTHSILPPTSNDAMHLEFLGTFYMAMKHASFWEAVVITWIWPCFYPSGSYLITYLYGLVYGNGIIPAYTSLTLILPVLLASVYYIIRPRCGYLVAVVALLATISVPQGVLCCAHYPSDLQVGLGACMTLCALFNCDIFRRRGMSLIFGAVFGYSLMFKSNVAWFIAPALAVLLLARWREWCRAPLTVLWHLSLFVGAFVVCLHVTKTHMYLDEEMAINVSYLSPGVQKMLLLVAGVCLAWWLLALVHWRKLKYVPMLTNLSHALTITFFISMPWILSNLRLVEAQRGVFWNQLVAYSNPEQLRQCAESVTFNSFGTFFLILTGLSVLFSLTKWANAYDRALVLSTLFGYVITACSLGLAARYFFPCFVISACCLAAPLRQCKFIAVIAVAFGLYGTLTAMVIPSDPQFDKLISNKYGYLLANKDIAIGKRYNRSKSPNDSIFSHIWQACPALSSDKAPRWIVLYKNDGRISHDTKNGFGFDPIEDTYHAITAWSAWHGSRLIPYYYRNMESPTNVDTCAYLAFINATKKQFPSCARTICSTMGIHNKSTDLEIMQSILHNSSHFIDIEVRDGLVLQKEEVSALMNCNNLSHTVLISEYYTIHIWSRPQDAPNIKDMNRDANLLVPYMRDYNPT